MTRVTVYEAGDGRRFDKESDCLAYEIKLHKAEVCNAILGRKPGDPNGGCYMQHDFIDVATFRAKLNELTGGVNGRVLDDSNSPYYTLYIRSMCIDDQNREWGQRYYAKNPNTNAVKER